MRNIKREARNKRLLGTVEVAQILVPEKESEQGYPGNLISYLSNILIDKSIRLLSIFLIIKRCI